MNLQPHYFLHVPLELPVRIISLDGLPKVFAQSLPVVPFNLVLQQKSLEQGATAKSLSTYARAARLYTEFCAQRRRGLVDIADQEFLLFKQALLGNPFPNVSGEFVFLPGKRGKRTADLMLTLLYSLAGSITTLYHVPFDWRRYHAHPEQAQANPQGHASTDARVHRFKWTPRKVMGLPDAQFVTLLHAAYTRWGQVITAGDQAYAQDPDAQRGALFFRNVALLMVLRYAGSRRSEATDIRFQDIALEEAELFLSTKGHRIEGGQKLPVLLYRHVYDILWLYATSFRAIGRRPTQKESQTVFVSHGLRHYGKPLHEESVRALIDTLRPSLDAPWNTTLTPHMLRHAYGYELQRYGGAAAVTINMRHASSRSGEPYTASPEILAEELLPITEATIARIIEQAQLTEVFAHVQQSHP